jgi:hypothetical protein
MRDQLGRLSASSRFAAYGLLAAIVAFEGAAIVSRADVFWPFSPHKMFASLKPKRPFPVWVLRAAGPSGEVDLVHTGVVSFEIQRLLLRGLGRGGSPPDRERYVAAVVQYVADALARARARGASLPALDVVRAERWDFPLDDLGGSRLARERTIVFERPLP